MNFSASNPVPKMHAIEKLVCDIVFAQPLSISALMLIRDGLNDFSKELPGKQEERRLNSVPMNFEGLPSGLAEMFGARANERHSRFIAAEDGSVQWRVAVTAEGVAIECGDYQNYTLFIERACKYLRRLISLLPSEDGVVFFREFRLQFVNRFDYGSGPDLGSYSPKEIFREDSRFLTEQSFSSGLMWHVFQGWFESFAEPSWTVLNQLNIQNSLINEVTKEVATLIEHHMLVRPLAAPLPTSELLAEGFFKLENLIPSLFSRNTVLMRELLNAEKLNLIGYQDA